MIEAGATRQRTMTLFYDQWQPLADSLPRWYFIGEQGKNHGFHVRASCCLYFKGKNHHSRRHPGRRAALDMARTAVRRAERCVSRPMVEDLIENAEILGYLNRLSSLPFVLGRYMVARTGGDPMTFAKQRLPE